MPLLEEVVPMPFKPDTLLGRMESTRPRAKWQVMMNELDKSQSETMTPISAWTHVAKAENGQQVVDGIVSGLAAPLFDGIVGYGIESQLSAPLEEEVLFSRGAVRQPGSSNPNPTLLNESASDFVVLPTQVSVNVSTHSKNNFSLSKSWLT